MKQLEQQNLLIDADDTLWENNVYFERVIEEVKTMLAPFGIAPQLFRKHLDALERKHIAIYGYGTLNFTRSLLQAFEELVPSGRDLRHRVETLGLDILNRPVEIIEGVPETLEYLSGRHLLYLVTKGDPEEQSRKVERSGLAGYFEGVEILPEKTARTYEQLRNQHGWDPQRTWMIGNSPRSDVNPAVSAGLNAVFIPHPYTWVLEHEEPASDPRVLLLEKFADLCLHF